MVSGTSVIRMGFSTVAIVAGFGQVMKVVDWGRGQNGESRKTRVVSLQLVKKLFPRSVSLGLLRSAYSSARTSVEHRNSIVKDRHNRGKNSDLWITRVDKRFGQA